MTDLPATIISIYVEPPEVGVEATSIHIPSSDRYPHFSMAVDINGSYKGSHYIGIET